MLAFNWRPPDWRSRSCEILLLLFFECSVRLGVHLPLLTVCLGAPFVTPHGALHVECRVSPRTPHIAPLPPPFAFCHLALLDRFRSKSARLFLRIHRGREVETVPNHQLEEIITLDQVAQVFENLDEVFAGHARLVTEELVAEGRIASIEYQPVK